MTVLAVCLRITLLSAAGLLLASLVLARRGRTLQPGESPLPREEMRRHRQWLFYCNPDDPRGWVPKITGPGWTVNVRTRAGALVMLVFTIGTIAGVLGTLLGALGGLR